jgi:replicative DNA helicase
VVAISSVNRQSYDRAPSLDAFKGSGDLEYDADACLLLRLAASSDEQAQQMAQSTGVVPVQLFLIGKNRYGPTNLDDPILLDFDRAYGGFRQRGGADPGRNGPPALYPVP